MSDATLNARRAMNSFLRRHGRFPQTREEVEEIFEAAKFLTEFQAREGRQWGHLSEEHRAFGDALVADLDARAAAKIDWIEP